MMRIFIISRLTLRAQAIKRRRMKGKDMEKREIYTKFQKNNLKDDTMDIYTCVGG
jgi:hypothetical protein